MSEALQQHRGGTEVLETWNGEAVDAGAVPVLRVERFRTIVLEVLRAGGRLAALFGRPVGDRVLLTAVVADDPEGKLGLLSTEVAGAYPALSSAAPAAQGFEREIAEQLGVRPEGHPWLKPLRFEPPLRAGPDAFGRKDPRATIPGEYPFFTVQGEEVHEVAVGPVHAGIIEPGHFRFQCHGEHVFHLEIVLGYQHRGVERCSAAAPIARIAHPRRVDRRRHRRSGTRSRTCKAIEALARHDPAARAHGAPRRGARAGAARQPRRRPRGARGDVGFLPTASLLRRAARATS